MIEVIVWNSTEKKKNNKTFPFCAFKLIHLTFIWYSETHKKALRYLLLMGTSVITHHLMSRFNISRIFFSKIFNKHLLNVYWKHSVKVSTSYLWLNENNNQRVDLPYILLLINYIEWEVWSTRRDSEQSLCFSTSRGARGGSGIWLGWTPHWWGVPGTSHK